MRIERKRTTERQSLWFPARHSIYESRRCGSGIQEQAQSVTQIYLRCGPRMRARHLWWSRRSSAELSLSRVIFELSSGPRLRWLPLYGAARMTNTRLSRLPPGPFFPVPPVALLCLFALGAPLVLSGLLASRRKSKAPGCAKRAPSIDYHMWRKARGKIKSARGQPGRRKPRRRRWIARTALRWQRGAPVAVAAAPGGGRQESLSRALLI